MREALGSYLNYVVLFVFLLLITGFIALAMNYSKAYRMKNTILTALEKNEGNINHNVETTIAEKAAALGYHIPSSTPEEWRKEDIDNSSYTCITNEGWCYKKNNDVKYKSVDIVVFINVDIPVINKVVPKSFFSMGGTTNSIPKFND